MLVKGRVVVVEGTAARRPIAMIVQGQDARGRWKLKLTGEQHVSLASQRHGATVLIDGEPHVITGHNGNHLRVEPVTAGWGATPRPERRRVRAKTKEAIVTQNLTLVTSEGVSITMSAPANEPPARVALWGDLAFVLNDREARTYHEASVVRVPADPIRGARDAARIAEKVAT